MGCTSFKINEMEILGNKQATEKIRVTEKFDALETSQKTLAETVRSLLDVIKSERDMAKKETAALQQGINESRNEARKESVDARDVASDVIIERLHARQRKDLLETDGQKKERQRRRQPSNVRQKSIVGFMSLMDVL
jgi:hypothetical protein